MSKKHSYRKRVAIFFNSFVEVSNQPEKRFQQILKKWSPGNLVFEDSKINSLIEQNAPIDIYYQDVVH